MTKKCELTGVLPLKGITLVMQTIKQKDVFYQILKKFLLKAIFKKKYVRLNVSNAALKNC